jgi:cytochrome c oxidase cbb3-type subunit 2
MRRHAGAVVVRITVTALGVVTLMTVAAGRPLAQESRDSSRGRTVYEANCAICHGERGDGRGHAAQHFATPPRDFVAGRYKIRSTGSGQLPTDDDLRRSIVRGLPGTGMVPHDHLSREEVDAVIEYVKRFSSRFAAGSARTVIPIPAAPPSGPAAVARGREVYQKAECYECHGRAARGDGPSAKDLKIKPTDLTRRPFKGGPAAFDIARTVLTGLDGTPMPSYHLVLEDQEIWDLAYYVESLGGPVETTDDEKAGWHVVRTHQRRGR